MIRRILVALAIAGALSQAAIAKPRTAVVERGILGWLLSPMTEIAADLRARGVKVTIREYWQPQISADVVIGHSMGDRVLMAKAVKYIVIDGTMLARACPKAGRCVSYYNPRNKFPLLFCCGGFPVKGAKIRRVSFDHVSMPRRIADEVVSEAMRQGP